MPHIFFLLGVRIVERLHREFALVDALQARGFRVTVGIPSETISNNGYQLDLFQRDRLEAYDWVYLETKEEVFGQIDRFRYIVAGTWKEYTPFIEYARRHDRFTLVFNSATGTDHWTCGAEYTCLKSRFYQAMFEDWIGRGLRPDEQTKMVVTGTVAHEQMGQSLATLSESALRDFYGFKSGVPILMIFPKGLAAIQTKVRKWFPDWQEQAYVDYVDRLKHYYREACRIGQQAGYGVLVKPHPSVYAENFGSNRDEYEFWKGLDGVRLLDADHAYNAYHYMTLGLSVNSHSCLDAGYYRKPFIYLESDTVPLPDAYTMNIHDFCSLPIGPSMGRDQDATQLNPWFPAWVGYFSRLDGLEDLLKTADWGAIPRQQYDDFIQEFWYSDDGRSVERVADMIAGSIREWNGKAVHRLLRRTRRLAGRWYRRVMA